MEFETKLTLLFIGAGALAGSVCGLIPISQASLALAVLVLAFYASYKVAPNILKVQIAQFPDGKWTFFIALKKVFSIFFIMWLILWIIVHTLTR